MERVLSCINCITFPGVGCKWLCQCSEKRGKWSWGECSGLAARRRRKGWCISLSEALRSCCSVRSCSALARLAGLCQIECTLGVLGRLPGVGDKRALAPGEALDAPQGSSDLCLLYRRHRSEEALWLESGPRGPLAEPWMKLNGRSPALPPSPQAGHWPARHTQSSRPPALFSPRTALAPGVTLARELQRRWGLGLRPSTMFCN